MHLPAPLLPGVLLCRYRRFLTDILLDDGSTVTAHTPNTGSMRQCAVPGHRVLISHTDNPLRKLSWTLELIEVNGFWVDTHTQRSNRVVEEGLRNGTIGSFYGCRVKPEFVYRDSRLDFFLDRPGEATLLEVKNVTLCLDASTACFPDAVTIRGQKHLRELMAARSEGYRAVILFLVQRGEATAFAPADHIDPDYGRLLREAAAAGVEVLAYRTITSPAENRIDLPLPVIL